MAFNPGDYVGSDEEIDIELLDSSPESKSRRRRVAKGVTGTNNGDSDSDFAPAGGAGVSPKRAITRRSRGRPRKASPPPVAAEVVSTSTNEDADPRQMTTKRGRGKPKKDILPDPEKMEVEDEHQPGAVDTATAPHSSTELQGTTTSEPQQQQQQQNVQRANGSGAQVQNDGDSEAAAGATAGPKKKSIPGSGPAAKRGRKPKARPDSDDDYGAPSKPRRRAATTKRSKPPKADDDKDNKGSGKSKQTTLDEAISLASGVGANKKYDVEAIRKLAAQYPDSYWLSLEDYPKDSPIVRQHLMGGECSDAGQIEYIDTDHPLTLLPYSISDQGGITGIALSPDGNLLATFSSVGTTKIWETITFKCIQQLRDSDEPNIDEFFVGQFLPTGRHIVVGGKLKDRKRWSETDEDNHILPCPLKIFDIVTGKVVAKLEGHAEEILCIKSVVYRDDNYLITTSQDGYIRRWHLGPDWVTLLESRQFEDGITCMAFGVSFVPNTGNRYFLAATDDHVKVMDMETNSITQSFDPVYSSYCDCGKFIEMAESLSEEEGSTSAAKSDEKGNTEGSGARTRPFAYFITRGVELLDAENNTVSSRPNTCTLHRLLYPDESNDKFELKEVKRYHHDDYLSNSWLIRITSNGRYLLAPTLNGQVFVFHLATGQVTAVLRDHESLEVRDVKFHPFRKLLFTCSDDGMVKVYTQSSTTHGQKVDLGVTCDDTNSTGEVVAGQK